MTNLSSANPFVKSRDMSYLIPKKTAIKFAFSLLVAACTVGSANAADRPVFSDEDFGKVVAADGTGDQLTQNIVLPITEAQNQRKEQLERQYGQGKLNVQIDSIDPEGGPMTGGTRLLVRGGPFQDMQLLYPRPMCKFGRHDKIVSATYVSCTESPLNMQAVEGKHNNRLSSCLQCEDSPAYDSAGIIPISISLTGDFTDINDSESFRYYVPTVVSAIYPRYGPKDGNTFVEVWGENFLNFDENLKCNFGSKSVTAHFVSSTFITCRSPPSDVVQKPIPFTVSLNKQQNSRQNVDYWYYSQPQVVELVPNYGPDQGGNLVKLQGNNFKPFGPDDIDNSNDTFCVFEGLGKMPLKITNSTRAYCEAPPNTAKVDSTFVEVMLNNRQGDMTDDNVPYFYYKPPKIYSVEPREGPTKGGTVVILSGLDFKAGKRIICQFGEQNPRTIGKLIGPSQVKCLSPKVPIAGPVPLTVTYDGDGTHSQSEAVSYLYYDTPEVLGIDPQCGPTYGYTQITVKGRNFVEMGGFGKAKCIFNGTFMNATIVDSTTIKCSSPKLTEDQESLEAKWMYMNVQVTLNARDASETMARFNYYPELEIASTFDSEMGPLTGNTQSQIRGTGFAHPNVCNPRVRYGAIEVTPTIQNNTQMSTISPAVRVPDSVVLAPSGNGQNYGSDNTLHFRDQQNTFTYYQDIFILEMIPATGPTLGNTRVYLTGFGIKQFQYENSTLRDQPLFVRFVDQNGSQIGKSSLAEKLTHDDFVWHTPAASSGTQANIQLSFNGKNWQDVRLPTREVAYTYYNAPALTSIEPHFGPVKNPQGRSSIITGKNFMCLEKNCDNLVVRFGGEKNGTIVAGELLSDTQIRVLIPKYPKPDVLEVAVSFNKQDFTSDYLTYGYFDPFLIKVNPRIISPKGSTKLTLSGFGFVFSTADAIKAKFGTKEKGDLVCSGITPCVERATYLDKNTILANTMPQIAMQYKDGKAIDGRQGMTVEVAVYEDIFTTNNLEVWYMKDPIFKGLSKNSVPNNFNHLLYVDTDFFWDQNDFDIFNKQGNFTCKFTVGDETVYTLGRMETQVVGGMYSAESGDVKPTHIVCASPQMHNSGKGKMYISINGQDFLEAFDYESSVPVDAYRIVPQCGPKSGKTRVKIMGSGFISQTQDAIFGKFGHIAVEKFQKELVLNQAWLQSDWLNQQLMTESDLLKFEHKDHKIEPKELLNTIFVLSPQAPVMDHTLGGPVYVSVGQHIQYNMTNNTEGSDNPLYIYHYTYSNSLVEFYYYKAPVVKKVEPTSGLTTGGTPIEISGIWFDQKTEYGMFPYCKIGSMIVRASFSSTVRIVCYSPPSDYIVAPLPIKVSLNGVDWHDTGFTFSYYYQPEVYKNFPTAGPLTGGTEVYISGDHFSNITNSENVRCKFNLYDSTVQGRKVESRTTPAYYINETMMWCASPSGFLGGDKCHVSLTFNSMDYSQEADSLSFTYFSINGAFPHSGPANAVDEVILIKGAGFNPKSRVYCTLNHTDTPAVEITPNLIKCAMNYPGKDPLATGGVKFGMSMDGSWTDFGIFYYYNQIELSDVQPTFGPNIGTGLIYIYGSNFRNDFINVEIGCKIGDAVGQGELVDSGTIRCMIEEMDLVNQGESLPVYAALNSYSWASGSKHRRLALGDSSQQLSYIPYGILTVNPDSGPFSGFSDILITGKGFQEENALKARCRFGLDSDYAVVDATVLDYNKMVCRSPEGFKKETLEAFSVPIGISFGEEEFKPWTKDTHRFHFYTQPVIEYAEPNEIKIGKMAEIYVFTAEGSSYIQPVPNLQEGSGGVSCSFEQFGVSMGMYVNETTVLCMTPHFAGTSDDYYRDTVLVGVALNGQDFGENLSHAEVTFVGTGSNTAFWQFVIAALLIALLLLACATCCTALAHWWQTNKYQPRQNLQPQTLALRNSEGSVQRSYNQGYNISNSRASGGFRNSQQL